MAATALTIGTAAAVNYTYVTDSSSDWSSVPNSTYFYDKTDKLVHYKDSSGNVLELFSSSGGGGLTVGTTAVTSGTDTRVFFQAGGVLQQSGQFVWDDTNRALRLLGSGGSGTATWLQVTNGSSGTATGDGMLIGYGTDNNARITLQDGNNLIFQTSGGTSSIDLNSSAASVSSSLIIGAATGSINTGVRFQVESPGTGASNYPFRVNGLASSKIHFMNGAGQFGLYKSSTTLGAILDVSAPGALSTDIAFRIRNSADTADILTVAGNRTVWARGGGNQTTNTAFGETAFYTNTTGTENVAIGYGALEFNTTGYRNVAIGRAALNVSTVEGQNTAVGYAALQSNTTAYNNTGIGAVALANNTTGINNTSLGSNALKENTTGSDNIAIGFESGKRITGGSSLTSATSSIFIGSDTRANSTAQSNQIVIGYQAEGLGSNTAVFGNDSITTTQLRGNVISGNQAALATTATDGFLYIPTCAGTPTGTPTAITGKVPMVADTTNNKLYIYVGGAWTAMN